MDIDAATLTTDRLRLRPLTDADVDAMHALWTDPDVLRYLLDGEVMSRQWTSETVHESVSTFAENGLGLWAIERPDFGDIIGFCGLRIDPPKPEAGLLYGLLPAFWGRGLATEAARAMLAYGFNGLGLKRIIAGVDSPNAGSVNVLGKLGMQLESKEPGPFGETYWYGMSIDAYAG